MDSVVGEGLAMYETAGSLGHGEKVWLLVKLPDNFEVIAQDLIDPYLLLVMGHDGSMSVKLLLTLIRAVCQNTVNAAIRGAENVVSIRHTGNVEERTRKAFELLGIAKKQSATLKELYQYLASRTLMGENLKNVVYSIFPAPEGEKPSTRLENIRKTVMTRIESGAGTEIPGVLGTAWGAYNGVIEYLDHFKVQKGVKKDPEGASDRRMESILWGNVAATRDRAVKLILEAVA
jgi:phage/plasmid-like protein (TIGR03299 family)